MYLCALLSKNCVLFNLLQVMGRHRRAQPLCPFVLNLSNNVPLATSPQPPPHIQVRFTWGLFGEIMLKNYLDYLVTSTRELRIDNIVTTSTYFF